MLMPKKTKRPAKDLSTLTTSQLEEYRDWLVTDCEALEEFYRYRKEQIDQEIWKLNSKRGSLAEALEARVEKARVDLKEIVRKRERMKLKTKRVSR